MPSGCNCGSNCSCGSDCKCGKYSDPAFTEVATTETLIVGVAPVKMHLEGSEMNYGTENCGCGDNCSCNPCKCGKLNI
uniref:Metallothionein-like protein n=1 Tax=Mangifera indica TaxID=29780 RepID=D7R1S2_MANIN|nr:metallothionein [Mangifera indica]